MKKIIFTLFFISSYSLIAQLPGNNVFQYTPSGNEIPVSKTFKVVERSSTCITEAYAEFTFSSLLKSSPSYTFNDYYYRFKYIVKAYSASTGWVEITTDAISPLEYSRISNGRYVYSYDVINSAIHNNNNVFDKYLIRIKVIKYKFNNDFNMGTYYAWNPIVTLPSVSSNRCWEKPNLKLKSFKIKVGIKTYNAYPNGETPIFKKDTWTDFTIEIENTSDDSDANSSEFYLLLSEDINAYPGTNQTPVYNFITANLGYIKRKKSKKITYSKYISDGYLDLSFEENKSYYMFLDIDPQNKIDESVADDNFSITSFKYDDKDNSNKSKVTINIGGSLIIIPIENPKTSNYISIYNINGGRPVFSQKVSNGQNLDLRNLGNGLYSVHLNGKYVKQFYKNNRKNPIELGFE